MVTLFTVGLALSKLIVGIAMSGRCKGSSKGNIEQCYIVTQAIAIAHP